jgi:CBS domain-containing protein
MKTTPIATIMTRDVVCVSPDQKIIDVKHIYEKQDFHNHIPVTESGKLVGIVSLVDFMYRIRGAGLDDNNPVYESLTVKEIMTSNPFALDQGASIEKAAQILKKGDYHALPIVNGDRIVGIVSTADLIAYFLERG